MGRRTLKSAEQLYINLMKNTLTDMVYEKSYRKRKKRRTGRDWPERAYTMVGIQRLNNIQAAVESVLKYQVPGDLLEAGVWRGGACMFMKAVLKAYGDTTRTVWVADSFEGLPVPDLEKYPQDTKLTLHLYDYLAVSQREVLKNFKRLELYDRRVRFLTGWFKDTLPNAPIEKLAVLRLDGDYYESTMDTLTNLYDKVSLGGWIIVDDFSSILACRKAVLDFREQHQIEEPIKEIDSTGVYWIKEEEQNGKSNRSRFLEATQRELVDS